jgi:hypothetical protein
MANPTPPDPSDPGRPHPGADGRAGASPADAGSGGQPDTLRGPAGQHVIDVVEQGDDALTSGGLPHPPSGLTCPECGGAIWEQIDGGVLHFRCHVGHRYTADSFAAEQAHAARGHLVGRPADVRGEDGFVPADGRDGRQGRDAFLDARFRERAAETETHREVIRRLLLGTSAVRPSGGANRDAVRGRRGGQWRRSGSRRCGGGERRGWGGHSVGDRRQSDPPDLTATAITVQAAASRPSRPPPYGPGGAASCSHGWSGVA